MDKDKDFEEIFETCRKKIKNMSMSDFENALQKSGINTIKDSVESDYTKCLRLDLKIWFPSNIDVFLNIEKEKIW